MKKVQVVMLCVAVLLLSVVGVEARQVINFSGVYASGEAAVDVQQKFKELLEERSNGEFQVRVIIGSAMGGERDHFEAASQGALELIAMGSGDVALFENELSYNEIPFVIRDRDHWFAFWDTVGAEINEVIRQKYGVRTLGVMYRGPRYMTSNRPIRTLADLKGLRLRLPELLLMRVDKMSMATSIEARVPFLDHKFVGLVMSIPERVKLDGTGTTKYLFKETVRGLIPDEIIDRPKQGFAVPVDEWLRTRLGSLIERKLTDFAARTGYFDPAALRSMLASHDYLTWYLLNFVLWHELWIESPGPAASATPSLGDLGLGEEVRQARSRS